MPGKTRLALDVAAGVAPRFGDGVWLVELARSGDFAAEAPAIGDALGIRMAADSDAVKILGDALEPQRPLIVLDNFEHVIVLPQPRTVEKRRLGLAATFGARVCSPTQSRPAFAENLLANPAEQVGEWRPGVGDAAAAFVEHLWGQWDLRLGDEVATQLF